MNVTVEDFEEQSKIDGAILFSLKLEEKGHLIGRTMQATVIWMEGAPKMEIISSPVYEAFNELEKADAICALRKYLGHSLINHFLLRA